ncbi:MAG: FHA domain-containing protein [Planctomycetota bacterium]
MPVELIMSGGSHAGMTAPIHPGYYLVGRHRECQIRPKSKSVSRRHCLLLHNDDGFGALDLKSTRGTFVNGERIEPHQWRVLYDGDEIRFGKVAFTVSIKLATFAVPVDSAADGAGSDSEAGSASALPQEPPPSWQNADIASFLEEEDRAEYVEKYGTLPVRVEENTEGAEVFSEPAGPTASDTLVGDVPVEEVPMERLDIPEAERRVEVDTKPTAKPPRRKIDPKEYKRPSRRSISLPRFSLPPLGEGNGLKLLGVSVALLLIGTFLVYQVYRFQEPTPVRVRQNLD